jgi:hypothetical protein
VRAAMMPLNRLQVFSFIRYTAEVSPNAIKEHCCIFRFFDILLLFEFLVKLERGGIVSGQMAGLPDVSSNIKGL